MAQIVVKIIVKRMGKPGEIAVPASVGRRQTRKEAFTKIAEIIGVAVALAIIISELVAQLQESGPPKWFAVGGLGTVAVVACRGETVAVGLIGGIETERVSHHIQMHGISGKTSHVSLAVAAIHTESEIAATAAQPPVVLQHTTQAVAAIVTDTIVILHVHYQTVGS